MTPNNIEVNAQGSINRAKSVATDWDDLWAEERAAQAIMADILDRRGIKWPFQLLDDDAQEDILVTWAEIIRKCVE